MRRERIERILERVKPREHEVTWDVQGLKPEDIELIMQVCNERGLDVAGDNKFLLVRDLRGMHI